MNRAELKWPREEAERGLVIGRIPIEASFKSKAYAALKDAITKMDIYASSEPIMLDERELSEKLGVSRTPIREAVAMLEQEGFVRTVPRRGILVVRKTKREIVEMIQAWAALESMAARLIAERRATPRSRRCGSSSRASATVTSPASTWTSTRRRTSPSTRR